jgi:hypothetical protein
MAEARADLDRIVTIKVVWKMTKGVAQGLFEKIITS